jgi:hypothetical protein
VIQSTVAQHLRQALESRGFDILETARDNGVTIIAGICEVSCATLEESTFADDHRVGRWLRHWWQILFAGFDIRA